MTATASVAALPEFHLLYRQALEAAKRSGVTLTLPSRTTLSHPVGPFLAQLSKLVDDEKRSRSVLPVPPEGCA